MKKIMNKNKKVSKIELDDSISSIIREINDKKSIELSKLYSKFSEDFSISNIISYKESFDKSNKTSKSICDNNYS